MATSLPVAKNLIKHNSNDSEENDKKEKEPISIELTEQKTDPYNYENAIDFRWSDVQEENEEDIALANFIESLQKKAHEEIIPKSNWMIAVSYLMKRKFKKIFLEVISNTKIIYIKFVLMKLPTIKILPNLQGIGQRRMRYLFLIFR